MTNILSADNSLQSYLAKNLSSDQIQINPAQTLKKINIILSRWGAQAAETALKQWEQSVQKLSKKASKDLLSRLDRAWVDYYKNFLFGKIHYQKNENAEASYFFNKAQVRILRKKNTWSLETKAQLFYYYGMNSRALGKYEKAIFLLEKSLYLWRLTTNEDNKFQIFYSLLELISVYNKLIQDKKKRGDLKSMREYVGQAIRLNALLLRLEKKYKVIDESIEILRIYQKIVSLYQLLPRKNAVYSAERNEYYLKKNLMFSIEAGNWNDLDRALKIYFSFVLDSKKFTTFHSLLNEIRKANKTKKKLLIEKYASMLAFVRGNYVHAMHKGQKILDEEAMENDHPFLIHQALLFIFNQKYSKAQDLLDDVERKQKQKRGSGNTSDRAKYMLFSADSVSVSFLQGATCFLQQDLKCADKKMSALLSKEQITNLRPVVSIRSNIYKSLIAYENGEFTSAKKYLDQALQVTRTKKIWHLRVWVYLVDYFYALKEKNYRKIRYYYYRLPKYAKQEKIYFQYEWLFSWAKLTRYGKLNEKEFLRTLESLEYYLMHQEWLSVFSFFIPKTMLEDSLSFLWDYLYKEKKMSLFVTVSESYKLFRDRDFFSRHQYLKNKHNPFFMYHALARMMYFYENDYSQFGKSPYKKRRSLNKRKNELRKEFRAQAQKYNQSKTHFDFQKIKTNISEQARSLSQTVVLYYPIIGDKIYPVMLTKQKIEAMRDVSMQYKPILEDIRHFYQALQDFRGRKYDQIGKRLFVKLFVRDLDKLFKRKITRVAVIGEKELSSLPFAALVSKDDRFLIEHFSFLNLFYISDIQSMMQDGHKTKFLNLAALYQPDIDDTSLNFDYTRVEVELIQGIQNIWENKILVYQDDLTQSNIFPAFKKSNVWHIALPMTWFKKDNQHNAFFLLAMQGKRVQKMDIDQLLLMKAPQVQLLFLSHVNWNFETSHFDISAKKNYLHSINQKIGVKKYIHSLVTGNKDSALLVSSFYRKLRRLSAIEALRQAQLRVMQRNRHPYFWANYILVYLQNEKSKNRNP